jgi:hypothetical protein
VMMEIMRDAEELPYFAPFVSGRPVTDDERQRYTAWLVARGDVRGEVLALAAELADSPAPDGARQARLDARLAQVQPGWWTIVSAPFYQLNCGAGLARARPVRFAFRCPMAWEQLGASDEPGVRRCGRCAQDVHRCDTTEAAEAHALLGHCISVPARLTDRYRDNRMITGRPDHPVVRWARQLFGEFPPRWYDDDDEPS